MCPSAVIRDWLLAQGHFFSFDRADFGHDCDEILKNYEEAEDRIQEYNNRSRLWELLKARTQSRPSFIIREWLLNRAEVELFSFDLVEFGYDCDKILKECVYVSSNDPAIEVENRNFLWIMLRARTTARPSFIIREWLLKNAEKAGLSFKKEDFRQECDEILKDYVFADDTTTEAESRAKLCGLLRVRNWLRQHAEDQFLTFDMADFRQDCNEILKEYVLSDEATDSGNLEELWSSLLAWQRDKEYLSSLNLHRIIAKHVRLRCQNLESWVKLGSAELDGLADDIAITIRAAWKVQAPLTIGSISKFSNKLSFDSLDKFHLGLENLIGYPPTNLDFLQLMKQEHEHGEEFTDQNEGRIVDPKLEWNIVMRSNKWNIAGADSEPAKELKKRDCVQPLDFYFQKAKEKFANAGASGTKFDVLIEAEVAALRLWTGPMHKVYAEVLRNPQKPRCPYVTTLHAINSGITKLARIWRLPASRKVYRGYHNLSMQDLKKDAFQCVGGVEKCVLATSEDLNVAVQYSGDGAFILEIDVGQVNRGADVSWLSQFPHEQEILFNALSNVEFECSPHQRFVEGLGTILVYQVCVSANVKSKTLAEFFRMRKDLHLNLYQEARRMISMREEGSRHGFIKELGAACRYYCDDLLRNAEAAEVGIFNESTQQYASLVEAAIMLPARSLEIMDLALRWFETRQADPAEVHDLKEWQLRALRTSFKSSERPEVITIVLEEVCHVDSLFGARTLNLGAVPLDTVTNVAKLLSLNPELVSLKIEAVSATPEFWEKVFTEFCLCGRCLHVNGFSFEEYAIRTKEQLEFMHSGDKLATMIVPALLLHPPRALTSLSLLGSSIACIGAETLGRAFSNLQSLTYLDLCSCQIASKGCTGMSQNLSVLTELEDLILANNIVNDDGFNALAAAIHTHGLARLKSVDMRNNNTQLPSLLCGLQCVIMNNFVSRLLTEATCVAWNPGGEQIASAAEGETIVILDSKTGDQVSTLKGHLDVVRSVAWSPAGDQLASASSDKTIITWNVRTGNKRLKFARLMTLLVDLGTPCLRRVWRQNWKLTHGDDWEPQDGEKISSMLSRGEWTCVPRFMRDSISSRNLESWDLRTLALIISLIFANEKLGFTNVKLKNAMSTVSNLMTRVLRIEPSSITDDSFENYWMQFRQVLIYLGENPQDVDVAHDSIRSCCQGLTLKGHSSAVLSVAWSPGGDQLASASYDKTLIIWDAKNGMQVSTLKGHSNHVYCLAWSPGGDRIASASDDQTVIIWDAKSGENVSTLKGHSGEVKCVAWGPRGDRIVSAGFGAGHLEESWEIPGEVIIWDSNAGDKVAILKGHTKGVLCVAWNHKRDQIASGSCDLTTVIWDAKTGNQVSTFIGQKDSVQSVSWSPCGANLASRSRDNTLIIWNTDTGEQVSTLGGHWNWMQSVAGILDRIVSARPDINKERAENDSVIM